MESRESITQNKMQAAFKANKAAVMTVREAETLVNNVSPMQIVLRTGGPTLHQSTFDSKDPVNTMKFCNFEVEDKNIFLR